MSSQPDLFASGAAAPLDLAPHARGLSALGASIPPGIRLGTSSWSFPGWAGLVWDRHLATTALARHGLGPYGRHPLFGTVGVDRSYYEPLPTPLWREWADAVPDDFRFVVKATRTLVTPGETGFLDPSRARDEVLGPIADGLGAKAGAVLFQFPPLPPRQLGGPRAFAEALYRFLRDLPSGVPRAVEIRTAAWDTDDYRAALRHAGATHGFVVHPRMASLKAQIARGGPDPNGPTVIRWMLAPGRRYEEARDAWAPFDRLRAPDPAHRDQIADLARSAVRLGSSALVVVNNKAEGSSPASIEALARAIGSAPDP